MADESSSQRIVPAPPSPQGEERSDGWGFRDSGFRIDAEGRVEFTGARYAISGKKIPNLLPWGEGIFGAEELDRIPVPGGRLMSVRLRIGGGLLHLADEFPEMGVLAPPTVGQQAAISGHMATLAFKNSKKVTWDEGKNRYHFA